MGDVAARTALHDRPARVGACGLDPDWDCSHTELWATGSGTRGWGTRRRDPGGRGCVGGAGRAAAARRKLLVSVTPALPVGPTDHLLLIDRALRDEPVAGRARGPVVCSRPDAATASGPCGS